MPINTGFGILSIGKDVKVDVTLPSGVHLTIDVTTSFDRKQNTGKLKSKGIDGIIRHGATPDGWSGSFSIDRGSPDVDDYFAALEAAYYAGQVLTNVTITETIGEADGSTSQYRYMGCALEYSDAGNVKADSFITMKVNWEASRREKII